MVTLVGKQKNIEDAVQNLIELDYDAVEAYEAAINRLENSKYKSQLQIFCEDHKRHIQDLSEVMQAHNIVLKKTPSAKQWLTKGKVVLANLMGDKAILEAMLSNEEDTNTAYRAMNERSDLWQDLGAILKRGLKDEQKHKAWLESALDK